MPLLDVAGKQFPKVKKLFRKEIPIMTGIFFVLFVWGGIGLNDLFIVDRTQQFDEWRSQNRLLPARYQLSLKLRIER